LDYYNTQKESLALSFFERQSISNAVTKNATIPLIWRQFETTNSQGVLARAVRHLYSAGVGALPQAMTD